MLPWGDTEKKQMNRFLIFIGLSGLTYFFVRDALQGELTLFGHTLPVLALALLVLFHKPINAKLAAMSKKLNDVADEMDASAGANGAGGAKASAGIRLSPTKEGDPPDGVFVDDKGKVSISLAALPGEEDRKRFAGDPKKSHLVAELLEVSHEKRDEQWRKTFLDNVADVNFTCDFSSQPIDGPDGFPYFSLNSPEPNKMFQAWVIRHIVPNLLDHGYGVVINVGKEQPDWVLTYGDIVNFYLQGTFDAVDERFEPHDGAPVREIMEKGEKVSVGEVSEALLPPPVRAILTRFLKAYRIPPKAFLMHRNPNPESGRKGGLSLVFPLPPDADESDETLGYVTRALPWFLPRHYSILWMRDDGSLKFFDL